MMRTMPPTREVEAAALAASLAREIGLLRGNLWEPVVARHIANDLRQHDRRAVEEFWRRRLGLNHEQSA